MAGASSAAGRIVLEQCLLGGMQQLPVALSDTTGAFARSVFSQISRFIKAQARTLYWSLPSYVSLL